MKTRSTELYHELRKIDLSPLWIYDIEEKKYPSLINNKSRFLGSEFDKSLKNIISIVNEVHLAKYTFIGLLVNKKFDLKIEIPFIPVKPTNKRTCHDSVIAFNLKEYIANYNFQIFNNYGIIDRNEIYECQQYLNQLHCSVDINKFRSNRLCITDLKINVDHSICGNPFNSNLLSALPDLIIDDRLIDIKSDLNIIGQKTKYAAQIISYYFLIELYNESIANNKKIKPLEINKIGFYYSNYNLFREVEIVNLIPNKKIIIELIKHEILFGNYFIRELFFKALTTKEQSQFELDQIEKKIVLTRSINKHKVLLKYQSDFSSGKINKAQYKAAVKFIWE